MNERQKTIEIIKKAWNIILFVLFIIFGLPYLFKMIVGYFNLPTYSGSSDPSCRTVGNPYDQYEICD